MKELHELLTKYSYTAIRTYLDLPDRSIDHNQVKKLLDRAPEEYRDAIQAIVDMTTHIGKDEFVKRFAYVATRLHRRLSGYTGFIALTGAGDDSELLGCFGKSQFFFLLMACAVEPDLIPLCKGILCVAVEDGIPTWRGVTAKVDVDKSECYVSFDDGIFSGMQSNEILTRLPCCTQTILCSAFITNKAVKMLRGNHPNVDIISDFPRGKSVQESLPPGMCGDHVRTVMKWWSGTDVAADNLMGWMKAFPVYFDHKIPDSVSSLPALYAGSYPIIMGADKKETNMVDVIQDAMKGKTRCIRNACKVLENPSMEEVKLELNRLAQRIIFSDEDDKKSKYSPPSYLEDAEDQYNSPLPS